MASDLGIRLNFQSRGRSYRVIGATQSEAKAIKPGLKIGTGTGQFSTFDKVPYDEYTAVFSGVKPDANGTVTIEVTGIDTGSAAEGHLNAVVIQKK